MKPADDRVKIFPLHEVINPILLPKGPLVGVHCANVSPTIPKTTIRTITIVVIVSFIVAPLGRNTDDYAYSRNATYSTLLEDRI
jgi:hypothetical protein